MLDCSTRFARSARIAPSSSPTSLSFADGKACLLAPPQHGEGRDPVFDWLAPLAADRVPLSALVQCWPPC